MDNLTKIVRTEIARQYKSVRQFAFAVNIPLSTINSALHNGIGGSSFDTVVQICRALGIKALSEDASFYLTEETQTDEDEMNWRLPVYKEAILDKLEAAQERPYWEDEEGNKEYYDQYFWAGGEEFILEPLSKEEADALYEYVCSVDMAYSYDENLYLIVEEEAAAYFAGQKSVEEVVEIIQSRAQVYINESR